MLKINCISTQNHFVLKLMNPITGTDSVNRCLVAEPFYRYIILLYSLVFDRLNQCDVWNVYSANILFIAGTLSCDRIYRLNKIYKAALCQRHFISTDSYHRKYSSDKILLYLRHSDLSSAARSESFGLNINGQYNSVFIAAARHSVWGLSQVKSIPRS